MSQNETDLIFHFMVNRSFLSLDLFFFSFYKKHKTNNHTFMKYLTTG